MALGNATAGGIIKAFRQRIVARFKVPKLFITGNGGQFNYRKSECEGRSEELLQSSLTTMEASGRRVVLGEKPGRGVTIHMESNGKIILVLLFLLQF